MEGGAFIEWDFLRGVREGWFPKIKSPNVYSESVYGTCEEILDRTVDDRSIIHTQSVQTI
jgi:glucan 1,3-beta-glucosidase